MRRIATTIVLLAFVTGSGRLIAGSTSPDECCSPKPVGGIQELKKNTVYPNLARLNMVQGNVTIQFRVDKAGKVSCIKVVQSGGPLLDDSAKEAVSKTEWEPARQNGEPVEANYSQRFRYSCRY